jgi:hypothetical protein
MPPEPKVIQLKGNPENGDLTVDPTYAHVDVDQEIRWEISNRNTKAPTPSILVVFDDDDAFSARDPHREQEGRLSVEARSGKDGVALAHAKKPGIYHYRLAVCIEGHVYADMWCPTVVVR